MRRRRLFVAGALVLTIALITSARLYLSQTSLPQWHGRSMPPFTMRTTGGATLTNADFVGQVTIIDFGSTWCPPCEELGKYLDGLNTPSKNGLKIVWADMGEFSPQAAKSGLSRRPTPYTVTIGNDQLAARLGVKGMPTVFVLDRLGRVRDTIVGFDGYLTPWRIDHDVSSLLSEQRN